MAKAKNSRGKGGGRRQPPRGTAKLSAVQRVEREGRKVAQIRAAIEQFLSEEQGKGGRVKVDRVSPSRFRNMCRRDPNLLEQCLASHSPQEQAVIRRILG